MRPNYEAADYAISKVMQAYWTNFAKTGNPEGAGLPAWPPFQPDTKRYLAFTDSGPVAGTGLRRAQCEVYAESLKQAGAKGSAATH
jgi:para-nitrobenzyl esterase